MVFVPKERTKPVTVWKYKVTVLEESIFIKVKVLEKTLVAVIVVE